MRKIVTKDSPLIDTTLSDSKLAEKGLLVLGIERGKTWVPTPKASEKILDGDNIVVYGLLDILKDFL